MKSKFFGRLRPYLCSASLALLGALLLLAFFSGYLFTPAEQKEALSPEEESLRLEDALLEASRSVARAKSEEEKLPFRASVVFYKMAMEHSFPVWRSEFYSEVLTRFATLSVAPEKTAEQRAEKELLEAILFQEDRAGFLEYLEKELRASGLSESQVLLQTEQNRLLYLIDHPASGGREEILEDIRLIRKSLLEGKNFYHQAEKEEPLSSKKIQKFSTLLALKTVQYQSGQYPAVPANDQTLRSSESFLVLLLVLILLFLFYKKEREEENLPLLIKIASRAIVFFAFFLPLGLVLFVTTAHFAPEAALPSFFLTRNSYFSLPFFWALFLRLFLRAASFLPFFFLFSLGKERAFFAKISAFACIFWYLFGILVPLFGGIGIRIGYLVSLADAFFPTFSRYTLFPPSPFWAILIFAILLLIPSLILIKKKRT